MRKTKLALAAAVVFAAMLALGACAQDNALKVGEKTDSSTELRLENATSGSISSFAFKPSGSEVDFGSALSQEKALESGKTAAIYIDPAAAISSASTCDMRITMDSGSSYEVHEMNPGAMKDAKLKTDAEFAYLVYTDTASGIEVNTLQAEKDRKAAEEKAAKEAAEAQAAAEQAKKEAEEKAAQEQQAAEEAAEKESASSKGSSSSGSSGGMASEGDSSGSSSGSSGGASSSSGSGGGGSSNSGSSSSSGGSGSSGSSSGGEDACVDDLVLR